MKIGFPVVLGDKCYAIFIATKEESPPKIKFDDTVIPVEKASNDSGLITFLRDLKYNSRSIYFDSNQKIEPQNNQGIYSLPIEGNSLGFTLEIARHYELNDSNGELKILFSGAVSESEDKYQNPKSLNDEESLRLKSKFAVDNGYILILHEKDYKKIEKEEFVDYKSHTKQARLPSTIGELQEALKEADGRGRVFVLPIETIYSQARWKYDNNLNWVDGIASLLGLTKVSSHNKTITEIVDNDDSTALKNVVRINELDFIGKIGEIYYKALPTAIEYRDNFIAKNIKNCEKSVFDGAILQEALKKYMDVFKVRDDDDFIDRHLLINGPTGCGKTFLTESLMLNSTLEIPNGKAMYIAPTRSLVYQSFNALKNNLIDNNEIKEDDIVCSTGERSGWDNRIRKGRFKIALLVYEKANLFLDYDASIKLLKSLSLVIIDEIHMINHDGRGGIIDMFLAKISDENSIRLSNDKPIIRIAIVSTEKLTDKISYFTVNEREPIEISAKKRPNVITHSLVIYGNNDGNYRNIETELVKFTGQDTRSQTKENIAHIRASLNKVVSKRQNIINNLKRDYPEQRVKDLTTFINEKGKHFNSILVAIPSLDHIKKVANDLYKSLLCDKNTISKIVEFKTRIDNSELSNSDKSSLKNMADKGIFLHYAGIPQNLREWIEDSFNKEEKNVKKILFATETLFYGVNISTDCVILTSLEWPRENHEKFTVENKLLTTAEYHNILGRAGRPNHDNKDVHAYICIHANDFNEGDIENIINCYKEQKKGAESKLFLSSDERRYADRIISHLDDVSYPAFRTVIDAIKYLASKDDIVTKEKIKALLKRTIFYKEEKEEFIDGILNTIIEQGQQYRFDSSSNLDVPLLKKPGRGYKATAQAESLIVTGTHWKSIAPMYSWLLKLKKLDVEKNFPIELIVPALIAAPDLWKTLRQFCEEQQDNNWKKSEPNETLAKNNEEYALTALKDEASILFEKDEHKVSQFFKLVDEYVEEQESILQVHQDKFRKAIFFKLTAAFLKWLRGEEMDAISQLSVLHNQNKYGKDITDTLQTKYVEKANWLSIMMLKFFVDIPDILSASQIRELPTLSLRLRYGVVSEAIPYIGGFGSSDYQLERSEIRELMDYGITPDGLIKSSESFLDKNLSTDISKARKNVIKFHQDQIIDLAEIFVDDGIEQWRKFSKTFSNFLKNKAQELNANDFVDSLHSLLTLRTKITAIIQTNNKGIKINHLGNSLLIYVLKSNEKIPEDYESPSVVMRYPWISEQKTQDNTIEISICCGMVLATLIGRDFLKISDVINLIKKQTMNSFNIKDLVDLVTDCGYSIKDKSEMFEKLLQFVEL